jgi:hypothetical protein
MIFLSIGSKTNLRAELLLSNLNKSYIFYNIEIESILRWVKF